MSLRSKLLALYVALAVVPLVAVGVFGSTQSMRALEVLLGRQTAALAGDVAAEVSQQLARQESDALFLSENAETQRLYASAGPSRDSALARADTFLRAAWRQMDGEYRSLELRDVRGSTLYRLSDQQGSGTGDMPRTVLLDRPVREPGTGAPHGTLVLRASLDALLPQDALRRRVGNHGFTTIIDRASGRVLYHPRMAWTSQSAARLAAAEEWPGGTAAIASPSGTFHYGHADSTRVVSFVSLASPAWTVLSTASVAEFAPPFEHARSRQLVVVLGVTGAIILMFVHLLRRTTYSLEELTRAAAAVGAGNLAPDLPAGGTDEVGRLSTAFGVMVGRVRRMIEEVESSRQMAVLGHFASQIAHEIRNPLTSVKLNLQGLARGARAGTMPSADRESVEICLREVDRLDDVVRSVLALAQSAPARRDRCAVNEVVDAALAVIGKQASTQRVQVQRGPHAPEGFTLGDATQLQGAVLNLLLNALAAMPTGGVLRVRTEVVSIGEEQSVRVTVSDTGPGVPESQRERIFVPFHTSRPDGTGLGLPIARRIAEAHGGRLLLADEGGPGAEFVLYLPLVAVGDYASTEAG
jgi:signal transduction histidine kinase